MMVAVKCEVCKHWKENVNDGIRGECRKYAPRPRAVCLEEQFHHDEVVYTAGWPVTRGQDWCSEWGCR